ncbi:cytochrome c biogenesis heme-transporting ATPase CcmA [Sansalvadorimonas verongulae]|uniref:cytochrome c biogenesis heme-transporting ATPase CcmA n=1 Tax=Sansalvadorimonas verongulae TaxID=2172824 RepID=UPI0012BCFA40|nr:cytochrome c biogenesis heme-transporting ATPase CcmA [Sansalvadorimonas verongulae]MTI13792.1 cytochrome c biogenesis heme-transporting ATPase CcmA [Sansalvadorimonas verongulae]
MSQLSSLSASGLTCERDERTLFESLDFTLSSGEVLQVAGPNGAGKTTLMRVIAGLALDFHGDIVWNGQPVKDDRPGFQASLLYMGHQPGVKSIMTPEENLQWSMGLHRKLDKEEIWGALKKVQLRGYEDVPCYQLSAGQNRRVALARLFLARQKLWILDEPFTAIDKAGIAELEQTLVDHARRGGMVMMTTHHEMDMDYSGFRQLVLGGE